MPRPDAPEPDDGVYKFSATKIATWLECERKFGWTYIAKLPRVQHASAALGSACHDMLERYLKDGTPLDFNVKINEVTVANIVAPGLHLLPAPGTSGMRVEEYFKWVSPKGHTFIGYKDVRVSSRDYAKVIDHKTTSNLSYAKTPKDLQTDPQAVVYAADEFARSADVGRVELEWDYYPTRGANRVEPRRLTVLRDDPTFLSSVRALDVVADEISGHIGSAIGVMALRPNSAACEKYGGCPFQAQCNLSPGERFRSMSNSNSKGTADLLSRLTERAGVTDTPPAAQAPAPAAMDPRLAFLFAPKDPGPGGSMMSIEQIAAKTKTPVAEVAAAAGVPAPKETAEVIAQDRTPAPTFGGRETHPDDPINPPEAQRAPTPEERTAEDAAAKAAKAGPKAEGEGPSRFRRTKEEVAAGLTVEQAKAARASLPGYSAPLAKQILDEDAEIKAEIAAVTGPVETRDATPEDLAALVQPPPTKITGKWDLPTATKPVGFTLFVDCMPMSSPVAQASTYIALAHDHIKADKNVLDYRHLSYGEGSGLLSIGVAEIARERGVDVYLDTRTPEGAVCKERLAAAAGAVIQGVR